MIHRFSSSADPVLRDGEWGRQIVSILFRIDSQIHAFQVLDFEILFGAEEENPEVFPVDAKLTADFVPIAFVEKNRLQE